MFNEWLAGLRQSRGFGGLSQGTSHYATVKVHDRLAISPASAVKPRHHRRPFPACQHFFATFPKFVRNLPRAPNPPSHRTILPAKLAGQAAGQGTRRRKEGHHERGQDQSHHCAGGPGGPAGEAIRPPRRRRGEPAGPPYQTPRFSHYWLDGEDKDLFAIGVSYDPTSISYLSLTTTQPLSTGEYSVHVSQVHSSLPCDEAHHFAGGWWTWDTTEWVVKVTSSQGE